ncbi:oxidoreductase [bacterium endosymbiont of Escarpia laminata]|nr:MAG: oxidoreductase [bacterium endosymbiont of Escarpia laminata]RLJ21713.1 MAG: oxidoreductase [bacterium endosymbiont of Escarpia laminata]
MSDLTPFANRLRKNFRHWSKWAKRREVSCYRIYDRDIPEFPLAIDWYEGQVHAQVFARKGIDDLDEVQEKAIADVICEVLELPVEALAFKTRRRQKGSAQYEKSRVWGRPKIVHEGGLAFEVDLHSYIDTGLFLDHRNTRAMVRERASGRRFLNLFAYTGSFTVYAAAGGAEGSVTVDLSNTYQAWSQRNLQLNGFRGKAHQLVREDVFKYLHLSRKRERFDIIMLDPPSFSNSKKMRDILDVQRDHPKLLEGCVQLLNPGGEIIFSNNLRRFKLDPAIAEHAEDITRQTIPDDFKRHTSHRCWLFKA